MTKPPVSVYDAKRFENVMPLGTRELAFTVSSNVKVRLAESMSRTKLTSMGDVRSGVTLLTCRAPPLGIGTR